MCVCVCVTSLTCAKLRPYLLIQFLTLERYEQKVAVFNGADNIYLFILFFSFIFQIKKQQTFYEIFVNPVRKKCSLTSLKNNNTVFTICIRTDRPEQTV